MVRTLVCGSDNAGSNPASLLLLKIILKFLCLGRVYLAAFSVAIYINSGLAYIFNVQVRDSRVCSSKFLGYSQAGKATGFGLVHRGFESL